MSIKQKQNVLNNYKKSNVQFVHERQAPSTRIRTLFSGGSKGGVGGPGPPLFFWDRPTPVIWRSGFATALKPQVFFTRFCVDGPVKLHGERSHKDAVSVTGFRVGGKSIRETENE